VTEASFGTALVYPEKNSYVMYDYLALQEAAGIEWRILRYRCAGCATTRAGT